MSVILLLRAVVGDSEHTVVVQDAEFLLDYGDQIFTAFGEEFRVHALTD